MFEEFTIKSRGFPKKKSLVEVNFVNCEQLISQVKKYVYIRLICSLSSCQIGF